MVLVKSSAWLIIIVVGLALALSLLAGDGFSNPLDRGFAISMAFSFVIVLVFNFFTQLNAQAPPLIPMGWFRRRNVRFGST